jgi:hypothetical protein
MKKRSIYWLIGFFLVVGGFFSFNYSFYNSETEAVKTVIESSYLNGAFNDLDTKAMANGFHPDFAIFSAKGESLEKYPIKDWIERVEKKKAAPDFDPKAQKWDYKFKNVDVTGNSAIAKIELRKDGKLVYTDYLSLLRFDSGWKIVGKVYFKHP